MTLSTYHSHTELCDGKSTMEEMILSAIAAGCREIGLSPHSVIHGENWCLDEAKYLTYLERARVLKQKYSSDISVYIGIEQDYTSPVVDYGAFDYIIGSVHSVRVADREFWVDISMPEVREVVEKYFGGDPYAYTGAYYERLSRIYEVTRCDIIGHFDLVTKFIERDPLFDTSHPRYVAARDEAFASLLKTPALFEINTGAISRGYRTSAYPEPAVVDMIAAYGKPFVINSDSHNKDTVTFGISEEQHRLDSLGYPYVTSMRELLSHTRKI